MVVRELVVLLNHKVEGAENLKKAKTNLDGFAKAAKSAGVALAGAFGTGQIVKAINEVAASSQALLQDADTFGTTAERLQELQFAAKAAGVGAEGLSTAFANANRKVAAINNGNKAFAATLTKLGVTYKDANGELLQNEALLRNVADAMANATSESQRNAIGSAFFEESYKRFIPLLGQGTAELDRLAQAARDSGAVLGEDNLKQATKYNDALVAMETQLQTLKTLFVIALEPAIKIVTEAFTKVFKAVVHFMQTVDTTRITLIALVGVFVALAAAAWAWIAPVVIAAGAIALVALAVDDLLGFVEGKDSVIGSMAEEWFGKDFVQTLRDAVEGGFLFVKDAINGFLEAIGMGDSKVSSFGEVLKFLGKLLMGLVTGALLAIELALGSILWVATGLIKVVKGLGDIFFQVFVKINQSLDTAVSTFRQLSNLVSNFDLGQVGSMLGFGPARAPGGSNRTTNNSVSQKQNVNVNVNTNNFDTSSAARVGKALAGALPGGQLVLSALESAGG